MFRLFYKLFNIDHVMSTNIWGDIKAYKVMKINGRSFIKDRGHMYALTMDRNTFSERIAYKVDENLEFDSKNQWNCRKAYWRDCQS